MQRFLLIVSLMFSLLTAAAAHAAVSGPAQASSTSKQPRDLAQAFMLMSATDKESLKEMGERGRTFLTENFEYKAIARKILI